VGVDIEQHRENDLPALAKTAFHPQELAFFLENPETGRFYDIWTLKESYIKMLGTGFSLDPREFCVLPREPVQDLPNRFSSLQKNRFSPEEQVCFFQTLGFMGGYSLSLCAGNFVASSATEALRVIIEELIFRGGKFS
jgi:4'-phosphopantetheinyl transferase